MTIYTDMISDSIRWKDFISCTASGLQIYLIVICPDGTEVLSSIACPVCGHFHDRLSPNKKAEVQAKAKNGLVKLTTESGSPIVALQLKGDAVLIAACCSCSTECNEQLTSKALISQKLLNSFQGSLFEEIKGGQRAVELSTLRQMNHIVLSQFIGNENALEHSFDLILSALIILLDAQGSWLFLDQSTKPKQFVKGDPKQVNDFIQNPQDSRGLSIEIHRGNTRAALGVVGPSDFAQAKTLLPLMADECSIVLEIEHLFELINRQLSRVFGAVDAAILITDAMGVISYGNSGFEKLTGYQVVQQIGKEIHQFPAPWNDFVKNKSIHNMDGMMDVIWDRSGQKKYVNWQLSPIQEDGELFGWLIIINDRTDHYYWQESVRQAERLATTSVLVGSLAHEIRNPLSAIKGLIQLMGRKRDPDSIRGYIDLSLQELDRITMLINEFLLLGKPAEKADEPICLKSFLEELMPLIQSEGDLYRMEVVLDINANPQIQADSGQLTKAVMNLVRNAIEASNEVDRVDISLYEKDQNAYIAVRDYGPGVPQGIQDKLFRPFFTTKELGLGLGLSISQAIVQNHGGEISFWNEQRGGAVFNLMLPVFDMKKSNTPADIIICIKDKIIGYPVMQSLQVAGFKVLSVGEAEVLDLINQHKPSICLLEGILEQRNIVEKIKKNKITTIMILGFVEWEIRNLVLQLSLPINYSQLLSKIMLNKKGNG